MTLKSAFISIFSWLLLRLYSANYAHYSVIDPPSARPRRKKRKPCHLLGNGEKLFHFSSLTSHLPLFCKMKLICL